MTGVRASDWEQVPQGTEVFLGKIWRLNFVGWEKPLLPMSFCYLAENVVDLT
jgi:hypothetical protein